MVVGKLKKKKHPTQEKYGSADTENQFVLSKWIKSEVPKVFIVDDL